MVKKQKVLLFIVCYNAEKFIQSVLRRIPTALFQSELYSVEILIIDDQSRDNTFDQAALFAEINADLKIKVLYNPVNQGYGGNQKIGYYYAIQNHFDAVVLLHGDGQYAPSLLPEMIAPIISGEADVVMGSRMVKKTDALKGGMPLYKWLGNQFLTTAQNFLLKSRLSEFHTGYRAYRVSALASIPFECNSNYYDFDSEILIQLLDNKYRFKDIAIPTFYGEEISYVNSVNYGLLILWATLLSRLVKLGIFYNPKFDYEKTNDYYSLKLGYPSSHQKALDLVSQGMTVLDVGSGPSEMVKELSNRGARPILVNLTVDDMAREFSYKTIEADINSLDFHCIDEKVDLVLLLDIIEHLRSPEAVLLNLREAVCFHRPQVIITTGNVAFLPLRLGLMLGFFNYGKKGILDLTHTRLFTFKSLRRSLQQSGYRIKKGYGIPVPFPLALGNTRLARLLVKLNSILISISKTLFAYQIMYVAEPLPTLDMLLSLAIQVGSLKEAAAKE